MWKCGGGGLKKAFDYDVSPEIMLLLFMRIYKGRFVSVALLS